MGIEPSSRLRSAGLRVTSARLGVLKVLEESQDHPSVEDVISRVRAAGVSISTQAGYDVCDVLHRAGLARRIDPAGSPARYEARVGDNHHHLVCRVCASAVDIDCAVGAAPCLAAPAAHGFLIDEAEVTYWGVCPDCQQTTTRNSPT